MKFLHISDLHLGKRLNDYSLIEDQEYILGKILDAVEAESPVVLLIAGDVYDKSTPSSEAVRLFDDFLTELDKRGVETFIIAGNHDSQDRLSFGSKIFSKSGIHICGGYRGKTSPVRLCDEFGAVNVYTLPFIKPVHLRHFYDKEIESYTDAVALAVAEMNVNEAERNVILTHQFVTGSSRSDSEEISVGGSDNVDAYVFDAFDYVALGHIHSPQNCGSERIRYCGTPLKYSFSEARDCKSITVAELREKGSLTVRTLPLTPLRDLCEIKGSYAEIMNKSFYEGTTYPTDYLRITLTDEQDVVDGAAKLRVVYKNLMKLDYDNVRTRENSSLSAIAAQEKLSAYELFEQFYEIQNNAPMSDEQKSFMKKMTKEVWEGEE